MEQITAFALGVFIVTLVVGFVSMFKASKTVKTNKQSIDELFEMTKEMQKWAQEMNDDTHRAINNSEIHVHSEFDRLHRTVDSRVDKLEARIQQQLDDLARDLSACTNTKKDK